MSAAVATAPRRIALDKLGVLIALIALAAAVMPFAAFRANRIVAGVSKGIFEALPVWERPVAWHYASTTSGGFALNARMPFSNRTLYAGFTSYSARPAKKICTLTMGMIFWASPKMS